MFCCTKRPIILEKDTANYSARYDAISLTKKVLESLKDTDKTGDQIFRQFEIDFPRLTIEIDDEPCSSLIYLATLVDYRDFQPMSRALQKTTNHSLQYLLVAMTTQVPFYFVLKKVKEHYQKEFPKLDLIQKPDFPAMNLQRGLDDLFLVYRVSFQLIEKDGSFVQNVYASMVMEIFLDQETKTYGLESAKVIWVN